MSHLAPIAIASPSPHEPAALVRALLADAAEALTAYDHNAAVLLGEPYEARELRFIGDGEDVAERMVLMGWPCGELAPPAGAHVWGIAEAWPGDAAGADDAFEELARRCEGAGAGWQGGLVVRAPHVDASRLARLPRMGALRRPLSEAVDQLVACLRSDASVWQAAELFGYEGDLAEQAARGVIEARQTLPAPLCRLLEALG